MRGFVANTDYEWFTFLRSIDPPADEVNFWKPGSESSFKALSLGEPLFFKLKAPHNAIAGFGFFAHFSPLPVSMAWDVYGILNGAPTYTQMRERLIRIRTRLDMATDAKRDFRIGCVLVHQPVFWPESDWIRVPSDWANAIVQGKTYDLSTGEGQRIWLEALSRTTPDPIAPAVTSTIRDRAMIGGFGDPISVRPRLGQRSFRIAVLDSYERRCAVTSERTLPALEAAHIRQYHDTPEHLLNNGILFRADIHKLFDAGYVTVTPDYHFLVSKKIKEEFENGRDYYRLQGTSIRLPANPDNRPLTEALSWHNEEVFQG